MGFIIKLLNKLKEGGNEMTKLKNSVSGIIFLMALCNLLLFASENILKTPAELSNFEKTSTYKEVMNYISTLQNRSNDIKVEIIGNSYEGYPIPMVILAKPDFQFPNLAQKSGKSVILINANIHAGEVEGKEACLILMREILFGKLNYLLEKEVILIIPIFNIDGNEKIDPSHRPYQNGPSQGVGVRYNGQNLDLNRDFIKVESPEVKSLIKVLNIWDPDVFVDLHTTDGSYHQEPLTYAGASNPNGDIKVLEYTRNKLLPAVDKMLEEKHGYLSIPYGNFIDRTSPEKGWGGFGHLPRMGVNYVGLRNRISILNENYAYAPYKIRIFACKGFLQSILEYCYENCDEIRKLIDEADKRTIEQFLTKPFKEFGIKFEMGILDKSLLIRSYEFEVYKDELGRKRIRKLDKTKNYIVPFYGKVEIKEKISLPYGYLIPKNLKEIVNKLIEHGIVVEKLMKNQTLKVEEYKILEIKSTERAYQGHHLNTIKVEKSVKEINFPEGTYFVDMAQPLAYLIAYLLEPQSDDGLFTWNFFDKWIFPQWRRTYNVYPVYRLIERKEIAGKVIISN